MSSPQMTRMLGFFCWACATLPRNTVSAVANDNVNTPILPSIVVFKRDSLCDFELIPSRIPADSP